MNILQEAKIKELEENDADDEGCLEKGSLSKRVKDSEKDEEKDKVVDLEDEHKNGNVIHKKRRRKNVDCRDVSTQTERSDYMLIKKR